MPIKQLSLQCATCNAIQPHNQVTPNHVVHALVSLFLVGLWIPVWILIAVSAGKDPVTCVKCGNRRKPDGAATVSRPIAQTSSSQIGVMVLVIVGVIVALAIVDAVSQ